MELRHLRYFVAVAEEQNVTRAAERLHVSQPPLSRQIRDLEDELGVTLFDRTARSIRLTATGTVFLEEARAVLQRSDEAVAKVRQTISLPEGVLSVGFAPSLTVDLLPSALRSFQKSHPKVRVTLHDMSSEEMLRALRQNELDLSLMAHPGRSLPKGLTAQIIRQHDFQIALPVDHPLSKRRSLRLEQLKDEPLLGYSRSDYPEYFRDVSILLESQPETQKPLHPFAEEYDSHSSLIAAVESGRGVAIVVSGLAQLTGSGITLVPLLPKKFAVSLCAVWLGKQPTALAKAFLQTLCNGIA